MSRRVVIACAAALTGAVVAVVPGVASAGSSIDQSQSVDASCWSVFNFGPLTQSFTPAVTGDLTKVTVRVLASRGGTYAVSLAVYQADTDGAPKGSPIISTDTSYNVGTTVGPQVKTTLEFTPAVSRRLAKGSPYVLVMSEKGYRTSWCAGTSNPYSAGVSSVGAATDFAFATYMASSSAPTTSTPGSGEISQVGIDAFPVVVVGALALMLGIAIDVFGRRRLAR